MKPRRFPVTAAIALVGLLFVTDATKQQAAAIYPLPPAITPKAAPPVSFTDLRPDERIEVDYQSQGCWTSKNYRFLFTFGRNPAYQIVTLSAIYDEGPDHKPVVFRNIGEEVGFGTLTPKQLASLDHLLHFYRLRIPGNTTTTDTIVCRRYHHGQVVAQESFEDRTSLLGCLRDITAYFPSDTSPAVLQKSRAASALRVAEGKKQLREVGCDPEAIVTFDNLSEPMRYHGSPPNAANK